MNQPRFIDIHAIQTLPFSNPNRDEQGAPKTVIYGGKERTRISSQSWKRRIRFDVESVLADPAVRTRRVVRGVAERLEQEHGWSADDAEKAGKQVARSAGNGIKLEKSKNEVDEEVLITSVLLYLPKSGLDELTAIAVQHRDEIIEAEAKKTKKGVLPTEEITAVLSKRSGTINLFGRMLAELPGANVDGAVQMAHAFTTHETTPEFDFFSAVDDVEAELGIPGSGHINTAMFSAGTFYRYANVDVEGLRRNLGADRDMSHDLVRAFLQAFIRTVPTGKDRPTAPMTVPDLVHLAARSDRPVSMAAAFEKPIRGEEEGHLVPSIKQLDKYARRVNKLVGPSNRVWSGYASTQETDRDNLGDRTESFDDLVSTVIEHIAEEQ